MDKLCSDSSDSKVFEAKTASNQQEADAVPSLSSRVNSITVPGFLRPDSRRLMLEFCSICRLTGQAVQMDKCRVAACMTYFHPSCRQSHASSSGFCTKHNKMNSQHLEENKANQLSETGSLGSATGYSGLQTKPPIILEEDIDASILANQHDLIEDEIQQFATKSFFAKKLQNSVHSRPQHGSKRSQARDLGLMLQPTSGLSKRRPVVKPFNDNQIGHFPYKKKTSMSKSMLSTENSGRKGKANRHSKGHKEIMRKKPRLVSANSTIAQSTKKEADHISEAIAKLYFTPDHFVDWTKIDKHYFPQGVTPEIFCRLVNLIAAGGEVLEERHNSE